VFLAKKEIMGWPVISSFIAAGRHLTVDRDDAAHSVADAAKIGQALASGTSVLIFPEGTFTASPGCALPPGRVPERRRRGHARRPDGLRGARRVLRDKTLLPRPGPIELWVGEPISPRERLERDRRPPRPRRRRDRAALRRAAARHHRRGRAAPGHRALSLRLAAEDVERAAALLRPHLPPTPLRRAYALRPRDAWLKLECWQPTGSFKVRGALHNLATLDESARRRGVVAASAGNHASGVAHASAIVGGIDTTVYVPATAPRAKVDKLRAFPVTIEVGGRTYDDAHHRAMEHVAAPGPPTCMPSTIRARRRAGDGGLEIADALPTSAPWSSPSGRRLISGSRWPSARGGPRSDRGRAAGRVPRPARFAGQGRALVDYERGRRWPTASPAASG
jgi:hypothetical protein